MKTKTFVTIGILFMCGITIYLLQAVSTIESTIGTTTQIEQNNSPLPTPKPTELPEIATDAIAFVSERERIPIDQLTFGTQEPIYFDSLKRNYTYVTIHYHQNKEDFQVYSLLIDPVTKVIEQDTNAVFQTDKDAYRIKYGKLDPEFYEHLQNMKDDEEIEVAIWVTESEQTRPLDEIEAEVMRQYPEAAKAYAEKGVLWAVADEELSRKIQIAYEKLRDETVLQRTQPLLEWLTTQGIAAKPMYGMPVISVKLNKNTILTISERSDVAEISLIGMQANPASDIAIPTDRVPAVWNRNITGTGSNIAVVEHYNINSTAAACLSIPATRPAPPTPDPINHKSIVAAVTACNDTGANNFDGVAFGAPILDAGTNGFDNDTRDAIVWATDPNSGSRAYVVNESEYFNVTSSLVFIDKVYDYWVRERKFTAIISAGNVTTNVTSPGKAYNVITVGNVADQNTVNWSDDNMYFDSSRDNPTTGVEKPEVAAPGTSIRTVAGTLTGTSFAAPQVAGVAALLMQRDPDLRFLPTAVKAIIMASAVHNIEGDRRLSGVDGVGAIDASLADQIAQNEGSTSTCNNPCWWSLETNVVPGDPNDPNLNNVTRTFTAIRGERIRVAIAWMSKADLPTTTSSDVLLRNFDLHIVPPSGAATPTSSASPTNNFEIMEFVAPATGQYTIKVVRNASGDGGAELGNLLGIAWTKQATYLPDVRSNFDNWTSTIYIRNDGNWPRNGKVTFFNSDGTFASESPFSALPANAVWSTAILPPSGWAGAAIVDGNEDLSVVVAQERSSPYTIDSYTGVFSPTASVRIPIVQRNNGSIYSEIFIQNGGGTATNITLQFLPAPGYGTSASQVWNNIVPGGWVKVKTIDLNYIGTGTYPNNVFVGSVLVTNSANQPLAIASTQYKNSGGTNHLYETSNTQPPAKTLYAPLMQNGNNSIYSGLALNQSSSGTFTVNYYDNPAPATSCQNNQLSNATHWIIYPAPPTGNPCNTITFAKLDATNDMVANVNQTKANGQATTYAAISTPSKAVSLPKVRVDGDWDDGFVVANYNGVAANITVNFYNATGTANSSPVYAISSNQHLTFYGATIPANFNGSVVVTSDQPVVVMVNSSKIGAGDFQGSYPGIHR